MEIKEKFKIYLINFRIRHYQYTLWLSLCSILYGISLLVNEENVISRVRWFDSSIDGFIGILMITMASLKIIGVLFEWKPVKRFSLLGTLFSWLLIFWAYFFNSQIQNNSWIMAITIIGFCYIALYRGDFSE